MEIVTIDTGLETMTGGRLGRIRHLLDESGRVLHDLWRWGW